MMLKDQEDPYIKAYALSPDNGTSFFNLNKDTQSSATIKILISIAGVVYADLDIHADSIFHLFHHAHSQ